MWIYEVTSEVPRAMGGQFLAWIPSHAREVCACPGFLEAQIHEVETDGESGRVFVVRYVLDSREALDVYLSTYAPDLRADAHRTFGEHLRASRRVMRLVEAL